jgi:hypothetical protein
VKMRVQMSLYLVFRIPTFYTFLVYTKVWVLLCRWFFSVSFTNKTNRHQITEILLNDAWNTITPNPLFVKYHNPYKTDCHNMAEILLKVELNTITLTLIHTLYIYIWPFCLNRQLPLWVWSMGDLNSEHWWW